MVGLAGCHGCYMLSTLFRCLILLDMQMKCPPVPQFYMLYTQTWYQSLVVSHSPPFICYFGGLPCWSRQRCTKWPCCAVLGWIRGVLGWFCTVLCNFELLFVVNTYRSIDGQLVHQTMLLPFDKLLAVLHCQLFSFVWWTLISMVWQGFANVVSWGPCAMVCNGVFFHANISPFVL